MEERYSYEFKVFHCESDESKDSFLMKKIFMPRSAVFVLEITVLRDLLEWLG